VIRAWDVAFASMTKGEKAIITCPPDMAYGAAGECVVHTVGVTVHFEVTAVLHRPPRRLLSNLDRLPTRHPALRHAEV